MKLGVLVLILGMCPAVALSQQNDGNHSPFQFGVTDVAGSSNWLFDVPLTSSLLLEAEAGYSFSNFQSWDYYRNDYALALLRKFAISNASPVNQAYVGVRLEKNDFVPSDHSNFLDRQEWKLSALFEADLNYHDRLSVGVRELLSFGEIETRNMGRRWSLSQQTEIVARIGFPGGKSQDTNQGARSNAGRFGFGVDGIHNSPDWILRYYISDHWATELVVAPWTAGARVQYHFSAPYNEDLHSFYIGVGARLAAESHYVQVERVDPSVYADVQVERVDPSVYAGIELHLADMVSVGIAEGLLYSRYTSNSGDPDRLSFTTYNTVSLRVYLSKPE